MEARARAYALSLTARPFFGYWVINAGLDYCFLAAWFSNATYPVLGLG